MPLPVRASDPALNAELERLLYQVKVILQEADGVVYGLTDDQFNWSSGPGRWSIAQCLEHLNLTNGLFLKNLEESVSRGRAECRWNNGPYAWGLVGRWMLRYLEPPVRRKLKAPKAFQPARWKPRSEVLPEWEDQHRKLVDLLHEANGLDLAGVKVVSPVTRLLKYNLGAGFWIMTAHDRRHLWQARQVRNSPGFPTTG